ncbi:MAG: YtxH domain-containing protein [Phocaeicola sp.]
MKALNLLAAFIGGAAVGAAVGLLLAPDKGEETRRKIAEVLREKGINLDPSQMSDLVDKIASKVRKEKTIE